MKFHQDTKVVLQNPTLCPGADIFAQTARKALSAWSCKTVAAHILISLCSLSCFSQCMFQMKKDKKIGWSWIVLLSLFDINETLTNHHHHLMVIIKTGLLFIHFISV
jgi:hypothetical protein